MTRPSRTTLLLAGLFGALAVLHGSLEAVGEETLLRDTGRLLRGVQGADSWRPMVQAHALAQDEPGTSLYDTLFFGRHVKFLYPPTALLWIELLDRSLPRTRWLSALAAMSWLLVLGTLVSVAAIVDCGLARAAPPVSRADQPRKCVM